MGGVSLQPGWRPRTRVRGPLLRLLAALSLLLGAERTHAADAFDNQLSARGRQRAAASLDDACELSLPQRNEGELVVMEHDGSNYDMLDGSGEPNYTPRACLARRFFAQHGDEYDFVVVFTNFEFDSGQAVAFYNRVRNDESGIGVPPIDNGALFGSPARLKGYIDMAALSRYAPNPAQFSPTDPGFRFALHVLAHEAAHQWLTRVRFLDAQGLPSSALLGQQGAHWSYLLDSDASHMYGSDWVPRSGGRFLAERVREAFSPLDLFLMGFREGAQVPPFTLLKNPALDPLQLPREGDEIEATPEAVPLSAITAYEGPRSPSFGFSQKEFRLGFVFLAQPGTQPTPDQLAAVDRLRAAFSGYFFAQTSGVALLDTTLAGEIPLPEEGTPDLEAALAWLLGQQQPDGRFEDLPGTPVRDTAAALEALTQLGAPTDALLRASSYLGLSETRSLDFAARRARLIAPGLPAGPRVELRQALLAFKKPEGGFALGPAYAPDPLDTALALRALKALGHPPDTTVRVAFEWLATQRAPSGGWAQLEGSEASTLATAEVLLAAYDWSELPEAQAVIPGGLASLLARRNTDGGFGESPSSAYATALGVLVLQRAGASADLIDPSLVWLDRTQSSDGSWDGSRYATALVLSAFRLSRHANLVVPQATMVVSPTHVPEGQPVQVSAKVKNTGRSPAAASHAALYDGDPALGQRVGEADVPALGVGQEASVAFEFATAGRPGFHLLFVVADDLGEVEEGREDDNAASRSAFVAGEEPDLAILPGGVTIAPDPPAEGEIAQVAMTVRNLGEVGSPANFLRLFLGNPRQGGQVIGQAVIPPLAVGDSVGLVLPWNTAGLQGDHVLYALADASYGVIESDEDNNEQQLPVTVTGPPPDQPDFDVASVVPEPTRFDYIPQEIAVTVRVRNRGLTGAATSVALYDTDPPTGDPLAEQALTLGPRDAQTHTLPYTVSGPGTRTLVAVVDPYELVPEADEANNQATATLFDPQNTVDAEIPPGSVVPSATTLVAGETLTVTALVRNRGTRALVDLPVVLTRTQDGEAVELGRFTVSLEPAAEQTLTFTWLANVVGAPVTLHVTADPFGNLPELSEDNNDVPLPITVEASALPDLSIGPPDVSFQPDPPQEGALALLHALVHNSTAVDAGPFQVAFYRGDPDTGGTLIGLQPVDGVLAGQSTTATLQWNPVDARGAQGLFVRLDPEDELAEYDETNNDVFRPFTILGLPDVVLTPADVSLQPHFPREGEAVTVRTHVRNLGQLPAPATLLKAYEGEAGGGTLVATADVGPLAPGEGLQVDFLWTPASPAGERVLRVVVDAGESVPEQDEGNNVARLAVVVQDADFYLTNAYLSPDGDGAQDDTVFAFRSNVPVKVVLSDEQGQLVREFEGEPQTEGQVAWDGKNAHGVLEIDGTYTFSLIDADGGVQGRAQAVLDLNRSPIHDAVLNRLLAVRNTTCSLPFNPQGGGEGPAFLPGQDEFLLIVKGNSPPLQPGLLRIDLDGNSSYVSQDPWFLDPGVRFATESAAGQSQLSYQKAQAVVSPDGREVLILTYAGLYAVELQTGARRLLTPSAYEGNWSPDGGLIATGYQLIDRDGNPVVDGMYAWNWSPDGQYLVAQYGDGEEGALPVFRRNGELAYHVGLPPFVRPNTEIGESASIQRARWRRGNRLILGGYFCPADGSGCELTAGRAPDEGCNCTEWAASFDPATQEYRELPPVASRADWSPRGDKFLYPTYTYYDSTSTTQVQIAGGDSKLELVPFESLASPGGDVAYAWRNVDALPGRPCYQKGNADAFIVANLQNQALDLRVLRLAANNGFLLRGTASDANLDHHLLEYALQSAPDVWHPIGAASDVPVIDDLFTGWVPADPGTYLVRLTSVDRAGNRRVRVRVVTWDLRPAIANVARDLTLFSPNGDGVKDVVKFTYLVQEPTVVEVRVYGPVEPSADPTGAPLLRRMRFDHPVVGPQSFVWDGHSDGGSLVEDGRYVVLVNGLAFPVRSDATPPDVAWAYETLQVPSPHPTLRCPSEEITLQLDATIKWHVTDTNLKGWRWPIYQGHPLMAGTYPVLNPAPPGEPEPDPDVEDTLQACGGRITTAAVFDDLSASFLAEDLAGNRTLLPVVRPPEVIIPVSADYRFDPRFPLYGVKPQPGPFTPKVRFWPTTNLFVAETLPGVGLEPLRLEHRPKPPPDTPAGPWSEGPAFNTEGRVWDFPWDADFPELGLVGGKTYQGRFTSVAQPGLRSEQFDFEICNEFAQLGVIKVYPYDVPGTDLKHVLMVVHTSVPEPVLRVRVKVTVGDQEFLFVLDPDGPNRYMKRVLIPIPACTEASFAGEVWLPTRVITGTDACKDLGRALRPGTYIHGEPLFPGCANTVPGHAALGIVERDLFAEPPTALIERASDELLLDEFVPRPQSPAPDYIFSGTRQIDVSGLPEGPLQAQGRIQPVGQPPVEDSCPLRLYVDRTPPTGEVLQPAEGQRFCPDIIDAREIGHVIVRVDDEMDKIHRNDGELDFVELTAAELRLDGDEWQDLPREFKDSCEFANVPAPDLLACYFEDGYRRFFMQKRQDLRFSWDTSDLAEGTYTLRLSLCDRLGNTRVLQRRFVLSRQPAEIQVLRVERRIFSPNGDLRTDDSATTVRTFETLWLSAELRRGNGQVVRHLLAEEQRLPGDHELVWDGRNDQNEVLPDGEYQLWVHGRNACGSEAERQVTLEIDNTPPMTLVTVPVVGAIVGVSVDAKGTARDRNFLAYSLEWGETFTPDEWILITSHPTPVLNGLLGHWNTPSTPGPYALRLRAADVAENESEVIVPVTVGERRSLERLAAVPQLFSPNGDGRRETTTIEFELLNAARVRLEVRDAQNAIVRVLLDDPVSRPPGVHTLSWDGQGDAGPVPDGDLIVRALVDDGGVPLEEAAAALILDRAPPAVAITRPLADDIVDGGSVHGSIGDPRLSSWAVRAAPAAGGPAVTLAQGAEGRDDEDLASLDLLADGDYLLSVDAEDGAENRTHLELAFGLDRLPPVAAITSPQTGRVLAKEQGPFAIEGTASDVRLSEYVLSRGAGSDPAVFDDFHTSTEGGTGILLGSWAAQSLPDGVFTVRLLARDRANHQSEARTTVTLDGTPPFVAIDEPAEGALLNSPTAILGSARDANLESWTLESAPGNAATAYQWSPVAEGDESVSSGTLTEWDPLPADGLNTLRLTGRDLAGHSSSVLRTVLIDTTPPATPTWLPAVVRRISDTRADVDLTWKPNTEPDLAGYGVWTQDRPRVDVATTAHTDPDRPDGTYVYYLVARDLAGNESAPATLSVRVDLTPPLVHISYPQAGARLSGSVDVRGTAFSPDDFKEYRLFVGVGAEPSEWTLLRRATVPVSAGILGPWTAVGSGPHVIALEADDVNGNSARTTVAVIVDNEPPDPPVLTSVEVGTAPDTLVETWAASPSADVIGYLLYRNNRIANAPGVVIGDLKPFLLPGPSYPDPLLPDGQHCYEVVAMDEAGNLSAPSNRICRTLDNRPPRAVIVEPPSGLRFDFPIHVLAVTPDLDIAQVQFQIRPHGTPDWNDLNAADLAGPYETVLDPAPLTFGDYDLRAVARDVGGQVDAAPPSITVTYGDATPPAAPLGLSALVDGDQVTLNWNASTETDLAGYNVYRDDVLLTPDPIAPTTYVDPGVALGPHEYAVTAVDDSDNESPPAEAPATVYKPVLEPPEFPVTEETSATLSGHDTLPDTTVDLERDGSVLQSVSAPTSDFGFAGVALQPAGNVLLARAHDAAANRSLPSDEVVIISNTPPAPVTDLQAAVADHDVSLSFTGVSDPELFGYRVERDDVSLQGSSTQHAAVSVVASASYLSNVAERAFDQNFGTYWIPPGDAIPATWTVTFPEPVLVHSVRLHFRAYWGGFYPISDYRLEARWEGRFLPILRVRENQQAEVEHVLPGPFATDALRVIVESGGYVGIAEVEVTHLNVLPPGTTTFVDLAAPDGLHSYAVTAIDRYGASSEPAEVEAAVGDSSAPSAPTGLVAVVDVRDVQLTWNPNPEPDIAHYQVFRDGEQIATSDVPSHLDPDRPNGTYVYRVRAVDVHGNVSPDSNEAPATVFVPPPAAPVLSGSAPPDGSLVLEWQHAGAPAFTLYRAAPGATGFSLLAVTDDVRDYVDRDVSLGSTYRYIVRARDDVGNESPDSNEVALVPQRAPLQPVILQPTDADHPLTLDTPTTPVGGRAQTGVAVLLEQDGVLVGTALSVPDVPTFAEAQAVPALPDSAADVSADGRLLAYDTGGDRIRIVDLTDGSGRELTHPGADSVGYPVLARDGARVAYTTFDFDGSSLLGTSLYVADLTTEARTLIEELPGGSLVEASWNADGTELAFLARDAAGERLRVHDLAAGTTRQLASTAQPQLSRLRFSPDGGVIAALRNLGTTVQLVLVDAATGDVFPWENGLTPGMPPSWSRDGLSIAYTRGTSFSTRIRVYSFASGFRDVTFGFPPAFDPRFDPSGERLVYGTLLFEDGVRRSLMVQRLADGELREVEPSERDTFAQDPFTHLSWLDDGRMAVLREGRLGLFDEYAARFQVEDVILEPGPNVFVAKVIDLASALAGPPSRPVEVNAALDQLVDLSVDPDDVSSYPAVPLVAQPAALQARVFNLGGNSAEHVPVRLELRDATGLVVFVADREIEFISPGQPAGVSVAWTPTEAGAYRLTVVADPAQVIVESREDNNQAERALTVVAIAGPAAEIATDTAVYSAQAPFLATVKLVNGGPLLAGMARTRVLDSAGGQTAVLDERAVELAYGQALQYGVPWNTGTTWAGDYSVQVQLLDELGLPAAQASDAFVISPDLHVQAQLTPEHSSVEQGSDARFAPRVVNSSANVALSGLTARLQILPSATGMPVFELSVPVPMLVPGAVWQPQSFLTWPAAGPAGDYTAVLQVLDAAGTLLRQATAPFQVTPSLANVVGRLVVSPAHVLSGQSVQAAVELENRGQGAALGYPAAVEVLTGQAVLELRVPFSADIPAGQTYTTTLSLPSAALQLGAHVVRLRGGQPETTLDRGVLRVHGIITPPSIDAPPDGGRVSTVHPDLSVNNAVSPEGAPLTYEFEVYHRPDLTSPVPGARGVPETPLRTAWRVATALGEDQTYYWRARASDGFSLSSWTSLARFLVDTYNAPPEAPQPIAPGLGAVVATLQPSLVVINALDAERDTLTYELRLARDAEMSDVVASAAGLAEGQGTTSWTVPLLLDEDGVYYWDARANDGTSNSLRSAPIWFRVDTQNLSPSAPLPLRPIDGAHVPLLAPELAIGPATDPEHDVLTYRLEIDRTPAFDTPELQVSPDLPEGQGDTVWLPPLPLHDNTQYYWRASAHDGHTRGPWAVEDFFVNLGNDPPGVPVLLDPVDGQPVPTPTPTLRLLNTSDPDGDLLSYDFQVSDSGGATVAEATGVAAGLSETIWTVAPALAEDQVYSWTARARDALVPGPWAEPETFRVNAVIPPPGAPGLIAPAEGAVVAVRRPALVVSNAASPEGLALTYAFELYRVEAGGPVLVDQTSGLPEGPSQTSWTAGPDLADGAYSWRARATDSVPQPGPWMNSAHFSVAVDVPPAPPTGLTATPGDAQVTLHWNPSPEPDVTGYRIYRSGNPGGPYSQVGSSSTPTFLDLGLANGVTVYYVVTALDAHFESGYSNEAAATPQGSGAIPAEIRYVPAQVQGECVMERKCRKCDDDVAGPDDEQRAESLAEPEADILMSGGSSLYPLMQCVVSNGSGSYTALFGYRNEASSATSVPIGSDNKFTPSPQDRGQPTLFQPGQTPFNEALNVDFTSGQSLVWRLKGRTATATKNSTKCNAPAPTVSCPTWILAQVELPQGHDPHAILRTSIRLGGSLPPDPSYKRYVDTDGDGLLELEVRFDFDDVADLLEVGSQTVPLTGLVGGAPFAGSATLLVEDPRVGLWFTPRTLQRSAQGQWVQAQLRVPDCMDAKEIDPASLRLNEVVPIASIVTSNSQKLIVKFSRAAVLAVLPNGVSVEVRVSGTLHGEAFVARDHIRVQP